MCPKSYACIFFFQVVLWLRDLLSLYSQKVLRGIIIKCEKVTTILVITSKLNPKNFAFPFMATCTMLWPCTTPGNSDYLSLFSSHPFFMCLNWLWKASVINPFSIWSLFIIRMLVVSTVLDKISGKPRPPSPKSKMGKLCALALHTTSSFIWGDLVCCLILFSARSDLGRNKCKA